MSTQGLLTVKRNGEVLAKVVVGCNGFEIDKVKKAIEKLRIWNPSDAYKIALEKDFGCKDCLVVSFRRFDGELDHLCYQEIEGKWYWSEFDNPKFNPRWESGLTEYYEEVEI